jgi:hypothetical protein
VGTIGIDLVGGGGGYYWSIKSIKSINPFCLPSFVTSYFETREGQNEDRTRLSIHQVPVT